MVRKLASIFAITLLFSIFSSSVLAQAVPTPIPIDTTPLNCSTDPKQGFCPEGIPATIYEGKKSVYYKGEKCTTDYSVFTKDPLTYHYWALDEKVTTQGKANERARQFLYWVMTKNAIDQHPSIRAIWSTTQSVTLFLFLAVVALFGLGFIVAQRSDFQQKMQIWPIVYKVGAGLLYVVFSYAIIMAFIQLSEVIMKIFIESLGGNRLFNIYFTGGVSKESSYATFVGCRDLNYKVQEAVNAEMFLMKITNITYYVMGIMLILRKILLWFLLFAAPFLALIMPFIFIRNVGWVWIGVFAQWIFYGPLFALFLGALTKIWQNGIPFPFDFSRTSLVNGYIYPTGINIVYGGPAQIGAQILNVLNNGNYVDTFAEYVISLIMLWAVIFFPWWLLRIFRDYCCDGIMAMKNVLMSMYDRLAPPPNNPPQAPSSVSSRSFSNTSMKVNREEEMTRHIKLETLQEIKQTKTEDITKSLNMSMNKITDIAKFETNKTTNETVRKNIDMLSQPTKAGTPAERQKFMNIRTELFNRTIKDDKVARQILSSISSSKTELFSRKVELLKTVPRTVPQPPSLKVNISSEKVTSVNATMVNTVSANTSLLQNIVQTAQASIQQVQSVLSSYKVNISQAPAQIFSNIAKETGIENTTVQSILKALAKAVKGNKEVVKIVAEKEKMKEEDVAEVIKTPTDEPKKTIEETVTIPPNVSIEDYEEVKKMWTQQYEKGEVPTSENITSREQWVDQDIVFITNTLNKLLSEDDKLRQEGVDDLAYILPVFLINNLKGEELVVYLKAKIEAAKTVRHDMEKEKEITEKLKKKSEETEELVDVKKKIDEAAKTLELSQELPIEGEEKKPIQESVPLKNESEPQSPLDPKP